MEKLKLDEEDARNALQDLVNKLEMERCEIGDAILDLEVQRDKMQQFIEVISILSKKRA
jgi:hypothetical protein